MSKIRYVAEDGSDTNDGLTYATPKRWIQSALNSLGNNPGVVYVGNGAYQETVTFTCTGQKIIGTGRDGWNSGTCIYAPNPAADVVTAKALCAIENLWITGYFPNFTGRMLVIRNASEFVARELQLRNPDGYSSATTGGTGLHVEDSEACEFANLLISECNVAVMLAHEATENVLRNVRGALNWQDIVQLATSGGVVFDHVKFGASKSGQVVTVDIAGGRNLFLMFDCDEGAQGNTVRVSGHGNLFDAGLCAPQSKLVLTGDANTFVRFTLQGGGLEDTGTGNAFRDCEFLYDVPYTTNLTTILDNVLLSGGAKITGSYRRPVYETVTGPPLPPPPPPPPSGVWDPLVMQYAEADTLYLLDTNVEKTLAAGTGGGLISGQAQDGNVLWTSTGLVQEQPGKYRTGLRSTPSADPTKNASYAYAWMPLPGLVGDTIEFWIKSDASWGTVSDQYPVGLISADPDNRSILFIVHQGWLSVRYANNQDSIPHVYSLDYNIGDVPAGTWVNVAATLKDGNLKLYSDGILRVTRDIVPVQTWGDNARQSGLTICGANGRAATHLTVSDLRISRVARTPGQTPTITPSTLAVTTTATGDIIRPKLRGTLHALKAPNEPSTLATPAARTAMATTPRALEVIRTDKLIQSTPIKAGGTDATHPTAGISGAYSYDWQVVDRTIGYIVGLGMTPYISLDATPQILGGPTPPFTGTQLTTARSSDADFQPAVPNNAVEFGKIVRDLVHHCTVQKGYSIPYWSVWNEPDGPFWAGTLAQYEALYREAALAVKQVSPTLKVGGPEAGEWDVGWVQALITYCGQNSVPLDFVSWHYYSGDVGTMRQAKAQVGAWAAAAAITAPELLIGEWCWQPANFKNGQLPFGASNWHVNDWHAAFTAASLIEMQRTSHVYSVYTNAVARDGEQGWNSTGLMADDKPWANLNAFRLWGNLAPTVVQSTYTGQPGVHHIASKDTTGRITVLLAHLRYRKDKTATITLTGLPANKPVTRTVIDGQHSNRFDAGDTHTELEQIACGPVASDGTLTVDLAARSVSLLEVQTA